MTNWKAEVLSVLHLSTECLHIAPKNLWNCRTPLRGAPVAAWERRGPPRLSTLPKRFTFEPQPNAWAGMRWSNLWLA